MKNTNLLLIDDDRELCELLTVYLAKEQFAVTAIHDGLAGAEAAITGSYDIIILDVMLPTMNGYDVLRRIQAKINTPILMLTAKGDEVDRVIGLEIGADDYLPKPHSPRELTARLRAILRRSATFNTMSDHRYHYGDVELNTGSRALTVAGTVIAITQTEYLVLEALMKSVDKVVTKEILSEYALGRELALYDRSLDMHISHLRSKIGQKKDSQNPIKTIRGVGYMFVSQSKSVD